MISIEVLNILVSIALACVDVFSLNYFLKKLNKDVYVEKSALYKIVFISAILLYISFHKIVIYIAFVFTEIFLICRKYYSLKRTVEVSLKIFIIRLIIEISCMITIEQLFESPLYFNVLSNGNLLKILWICTSKYIQIYVCLIFYQRKLKTNLLDVRYFKFISILLSVLYCLCILHNMVGIYYISNIAKIIIFTLVIYNIILITFDRYQVRHDKIEKEYIEKQKEYELIDRKNKMQDAYNQIIQAEHEHTRNIKHNLNNQLVVIYKYIETGMYDTAKKCIEEVSCDLTKGQSTNHTGDIGVDAIINGKIVKARNLGINVEEKYGIIDLGIIDIMDLTVALGCALDNAIEAIEKLDKNIEKKMTIDIHNNGPYLIMSIGNTVVDGHHICFEKSSKEDTNKDHGYGVNSIKEIALKYDGSATYEIEDDFVLLNIIMYAYGEENVG